ncbi:MAG: rhodanese-like domain-containing protein [Pseudomonadota bacterium]
MARHMISAADLFDRLPRPDAPQVLDLRTEDDAAADPTKLPAARRATLAQITDGEGPAGPTVVYCQRGGKISQLGAALLRDRGVSAWALAGGHLGWLADGRPVQPLDLPEGATWVLRDNPDWTGLCQLWRLRRLVDPTARVLAIAQDQVAVGCQVIEGRSVPTGRDGALADWFPLPAATPTFETLLRGRLARLGDPLAALDLIDDALAGAAP